MELTKTICHDYYRRGSVIESQIIRNITPHYYSLISFHPCRDGESIADERRHSSVGSGGLRFLTVHLLIQRMWTCRGSGDARAVLRNRHDEG